MKHLQLTKESTDDVTTAFVNKCKLELFSKPIPACNVEECSLNFLLLMTERSSLQSEAARRKLLVSKRRGYVRQIYQFRD